MKSVLMIAVMLLAVGCALTPEQKARVEALRVEAETLLAEMDDLRVEAFVYDQQYQELMAKLADKSLSLETLSIIAAELQKVTARIKQTKGEYEDVEHAYLRTKAEFEKAKKAGVPLWALIVGALPTVVAGVGLKKYVGIAKVAKGLILGIEATCDKDKKSVIRDVAVDAGIQPALDAIVDSMGLKKGTVAAPEVVEHVT